MPRPCSPASRTGSAVRAAYVFGVVYLGRTAPVPSSCSAPPQVAAVSARSESCKRPTTPAAISWGASALLSFALALLSLVKFLSFALALLSCLVKFSFFLHLFKASLWGPPFFLSSGRQESFDFPEREMPPRIARTAASKDGQPAQSELPVASWRQVIHFSRPRRLRLVCSSVCAAGLQAKKQCAAAG